MRHFSIQQNRGFVVLFTVLIASIMLLLAIGISNVALKEAKLSQSARDAHYAFFSADTGSECALFLDLKETAFTESTYSGSFSCAEQSVSIDETTGSFDGYTRRYSFEIETNDGAGCAAVTADKIPLFSGARIESRGYNAPCADISGGGDALIERAIRVEYGG